VQGTAKTKQPIYSELGQPPRLPSLSYLEITVYNNADVEHTSGFLTQPGFSGPSRSGGPERTGISRPTPHPPPRHLPLGAAGHPRCGFPSDPNALL